MKGQSQWLIFFFLYFVLDFTSKWIFLPSILFVWSGTAELTMKNFDLGSYMVRASHGVTLCRIKLFRWRTQPTVSAPWPASARSCWRRRECRTPSHVTLADSRRFKPVADSGSSPSSSSSSSFVVFLQGVLDSFQQRGHAALLHAGDGRSHHPLRPRPSQRRLQQVIQDRRESWTKATTALFLLWREQPLTFDLCLSSSSSDERLHKGPEGPASRQGRRSPQRPQVSCVYSHHKNLFTLVFLSIKNS